MHLQVRIELYDRRQTKFISAHTNALSCLTLSLDGKRLATSSDKGTLIRLWNTEDGQLLQVRCNTAHCINMVMHLTEHTSRHGKQSTRKGNRKKWDKNNNTVILK